MMNKMVSVLGYMGRDRCCRLRQQLDSEPVAETAASFKEGFGRASVTRKQGVRKIMKVWRTTVLLCVRGREHISPQILFHMRTRLVVAYASEFGSEKLF
jgi:hypothetical protein